MSILPLVIAPDARLKNCSSPVHKVTDKIRKLMDDMLATMYKYEGVGLAAVQVGIHKRVIVMDVADAENNIIYKMANPKLIYESDDNNSYEEGCLSFPEQRALIVRPKSVKVEYLDYNNEKQTIECDGLLATCVQHEIDHLNGIVFLDHLSKLRRDMLMRKVRKVKKHYLDDE